MPRQIGGASYMPSNTVVPIIKFNIQIIKHQNKIMQTGLKFVAFYYTSKYNEQLELSTRSSTHQGYANV